MSSVQSVVFQLDELSKGQSAIPATGFGAKCVMSPRLELALDASAEAARLILGYYQQSDLAVDLKGDESPVTAADRGAEQLLRDRIAERFPDDGILGEEFGEHPSGNGWRWILDPLDGTKSFVHGVPLFGTLIGVESDGRLELGVCRFPALDEVVYAQRGGGTWWGSGSATPKPATVTGTAKLSDALFCTTTITGWSRLGRQAAFDRLCRASGLVRGWSDCYGHILVATGRADVMVDPEMNVWDAAALIPIVEEAGGHFVGFNGEASAETGDGVSVNARLLDQVLPLLGD